jgi:hypothetical protein
MASIRRRAALVPLILSLLAMAPRAGIAQGPTAREMAVSAIDSTTPLMVAELREACRITKGAPEATNAGIVQSFCRTPLYRLTADDVPPVIAFRCAILRPAEVAPEDSIADPCFAARQASLHSIVPVGGVAAFESRFLGAATDVLFARAQEALKQDVMELFVKRFCGATQGTATGTQFSVDSLLKESCSSLRAFAEPDPAKRYASPVPGLVAIRASFRKDLLAVPDRVEWMAGRIRVDLASRPGNPTVRDVPYARAVLASSGIHLARALAASQPGGAVLRGLADSLGRAWVGGPGATWDHVAAAPELLTLTVVTGLASTMDGGWAEGSTGSSLTTSEILRRGDDAIRAATVSVSDSMTLGWPAVLRRWQPRVRIDTLERLPAFRQASKIVQALAGLPTVDELRGATAAERRQLVEQQASALVPLLVDYIAPHLPDPRHREALLQVAPLATHLAGEDYAALVQDVIRCDSLMFGDGRLLTPRVARTLNIASSVALAQDGDAMRLAMESAIAPPDRYLAKRVPRDGRNVAWLNAYVGGTVGYERLAARDVRDREAFAGGLALPVGIELTASPGAAFMLQLLDLGQVLNYRFGDTASVKRDPPGLKFTTVFSPGVLLVLRPFPFTKRRPYAFLFGASYSPALRERALGSDRFAPSDAIRLSASFGVDVPILP